VSTIRSDNDAKRLLDHLLNNYDKIARPVLESNELIDLYLGIKLSQIADIDERNQIMTTNVWIRHVISLFITISILNINLFLNLKEWHDYKVWALNFNTF
jgi:hypothetical protein